MTELFDIYPAGGSAPSGVGCNLETAALAVGVGADELLWAIEEYGRCDVDGWVVVPAGDPVPQSLN